MLLDVTAMVDVGNGETQPVLLSEGSLPHESIHAKSLREEMFPIQLIVKGMAAKLQNGNSTVRGDKDRILAEVKKDIKSKMPDDVARITPAAGMRHKSASGLAR